MRSNQRTVSLAEAQRIVLEAALPLSGERVDILAAANRVLFEDIVSDYMIPSHESSARDGYAILAQDTLEATVDNPVRLRIVGESQAGGVGNAMRVTRGNAIRIMTGAPMPEGADAVVQFEDAKEEEGSVIVFRPAATRDNVRNVGENIARGDRVLRKGDRLRSADVGILASLNHTWVMVHRRPVVAIISTGDELVGIGQETRFGEIRDVNAHTLCAEARRYDAIPNYLGIARDSLRDVRDLFQKALAADVVISTGGVSMGRYDFVKDIYSDLRVEMLFERVNVKPGKPCALGIKGRQLYFGLPGNPVSALTSFIQFVRPALLRLMGANKTAKPIVNAILTETIVKKPSENVHLLRGKFAIIDHELRVATTGSQKASFFQSMSDANCLIIIPEHVTRVEAGQKVAIQLIDHDEI